MATTIAKAIGFNNVLVKSTYRLGRVRAEAEANTWRTFTHCSVHRSGSGYVRVIRDGKLLHEFTFGEEGP